MQPLDRLRVARSSRLVTHRRLPASSAASSTDESSAIAASEPRSPVLGSSRCPWATLATGPDAPACWPGGTPSSRSTSGACGCDGPDRTTPRSHGTCAVGSVSSLRRTRPARHRQAHRSKRTKTLPPNRGNKTEENSRYSTGERTITGGKKTAVSNRRRRPNFIPAATTGSTTPQWEGGSPETQSEEGSRETSTLGC